MNTQQIKETLGVFKVLLSIFAVVAISLIAWIAQNLWSSGAFLFLLACAALGVALGALFNVWHRVLNLIDELGATNEC